MRLRSWSTSRPSDEVALDSAEELLCGYFAVNHGVDAGFPARHALAGFFVGDVDVEDDDEIFGAHERAVNRHGVHFVGVLPPLAFGENGGLAFSLAGHGAEGHGLQAGGVVGVEGGDGFVEFAFFAEGNELGGYFVNSHVGRLSKVDECGMKRRPLGDSLVGFFEAELQLGVRFISVNKKFSLRTCLVLVNYRDISAIVDLRIDLENALRVLADASICTVTRSPAALYV